MDVRVNNFWRIVVIVMTLLGVIITLNQVFFWEFLGITLVNSAFLFFLLTFFLSLVYIIFPPSKKQVTKKVAWYDVLLFLLTIVITAYFGVNGENILNYGWDITAPTIATVFSVVLWLLVLEALRRTAGLIVTAIALIFSVYPLFAGKIPVYFLQGITLDFATVARSHAMGVDSILGLPLQAAGTILVGFLIFGIVLEKTGGATFFFDLAQSLFGRTRGGSAKVAVVSSGFMGMMSGSAVSNVLTTGPMTIPTMKKAGFEPSYSAGIEATASAGGSITPPVMGTAAFLMVTFLGIPYSEVAIAAAIPAFLYYLGIFIQVDAYSGKKGLIGLPKSEVQNFFTIIKGGWPYILALIFLIYLLVVTQLEAQAPFYTVLLLIVISLFYKNENRMTVSKFMEVIYNSGRTISEILGIIAGVGLIVGGLAITGVSLSLARELVMVVGDNLYLVLIAGAVTCFILGMGMTISAVYVFLAVVMAPALINLGVHPIAAHLFVIYWASVSYITPPVALASFAAAGIARTDPMKTSITAMKLGAVKYVVPFLFVLNPALVAQGSLSEIAIVFVTACLGVIVMGCGFEGWMIGINVTLSRFEQLVAVIAGLSLLLPFLMVSVIGFAIMGLLVLHLIVKRKREVQAILN